MNRFINAQLYKCALYCKISKRTTTKLEIHASLSLQQLNLRFPTPLEGGSDVTPLQANQSGDFFKTANQRLLRLTSEQVSHTARPDAAH